jgi:hypothetical protein
VPSRMEHLASVPLEHLAAVRRDRPLFLSGKTPLTWRQSTMVVRRFKGADMHCFGARWMYTRINCAYLWRRKFCGAQKAVAVERGKKEGRAARCCGSEDAKAYGGRATQLTAFSRWLRASHQ